MLWMSICSSECLLACYCFHASLGYQHQHQFSIRKQTVHPSILNCQHACIQARAAPRIGSREPCHHHEDPRLEGRKSMSVRDQAALPSSSLLDQAISRVPQHSPCGHPPYSYNNPHLASRMPYYHIRAQSPTAISPPTPRATKRENAMHIQHLSS